MEITREWLGKAAGWRALQEGRKMFEGGRVLEADREGVFFTGSLQASPRPRKVRVKVSGNNEVETHCTCAQNRRDGAFCGHAVALILQVVEGGEMIRQVSGSDSKANQTVKKNFTSSPELARETTVLKLPRSEPIHQINLRAGAVDALRHGRPLSLSIEIAYGTLDENEAQIRAWMDSLGLALDTEHALVQVAGKDLERMLRALQGGDGLKLDGAILSLPSARVLPRITLNLPKTLRCEDAGESWIALANRWWWIGKDQWQPGPRRGNINDALLRDGELGLAKASIIAALEDLGDDFRFCGDALEGLVFTPQKPTFQIELEGSGGYLEALPRAIYLDGPEVAVLDQKAERVWEAGSWGHFHTRSRSFESELIDFFKACGFKEDDEAYTLRLRGEEAVVDFLAADWIRMEARGWKPIPSKTLSKILSRIERIRPEISAAEGRGDWLDLEVDYCGDTGRKFSGGEIRDVLRRGSKRFKTPDGKLGIIDSQAVIDLDQLLEESQPKQTRAGTYRVDMAHAESLLASVSPEERIASAPEQACFKAVDDIAAQLHAKLRPYQREGVAWLWQHCKQFGGALLADDMGLGKTLQSIALLLVARKQDPRFCQNPSLVVAPTSLLSNWQDELERFTPDIKCLLWHGTDRDAYRSKIDEHDLLLTSYGIVARDRALFRGRQWGLVLLDEASLVRNPEADISKACFQLQANARVAITGTPVENSVRDLWSAFQFVLPGYLGTKKSFADRYEKPCAENPPDPGTLRRLRWRVSPHLLRRVKDEVATELPPKQESIVWCGLSPEQGQVYRMLLREGHEAIAKARKERGEGGAKLQTLTTLLRLRQCCCDLGLLGLDGVEKMTLEQRSEKLERLVEVIRESRNNNHKILVFSQFTSQLDTLEQLLSLEQTRFCRLDGTSRNRGAIVREFQHPEGPDCFLISLKAGGYGLNLTRADVVIHLDPWWNPAAERQATDRAHRIGQTKPVTVYKFITRGTVEEKILRLQQQKEETASGIVTSAAEMDGPSGIDKLEVLLEPLEF